VAVERPNRVFLADIRGGDQYLRATWHAESDTVVFSHWSGEVCLASTPLALTDSAQLVDLLVRALADTAGRRIPAVPASPPRSPGLAERIRRAIRPRLAEVIDASARFLPAARPDARTGRPR
jgi:hypothetical protein